MSRVDIIGTVIECYAHKCNSDRFSNMDMDMTYDYSKMQMYSLYPLIRRDPRPTFLRGRTTEFYWRPLARLFAVRR